MQRTRNLLFANVFDEPGLRASVAHLVKYVRVRHRAAHLGATPLDEFVATLSKTPPSGNGTPSLLIGPIRLGEVLAALMFRQHNTCLERALARYAVLTAAGIEARFVLGVRSSLTETGHAWVEIDGRPFLEVDVRQYTPTYVFPA